MVPLVKVGDPITTEFEPPAGGLLLTRTEQTGSSKNNFVLKLQVNVDIVREHQVNQPDTFGLLITPAALTFAVKVFSHS